MKGLVCKLPRWLITLAAALAIGLSVSAHIIGFDNNPVWGPRRIALLLFGMLALLLVHRTLLQRGARRWLGWLGLPTHIAGFESSCLRRRTSLSDWSNRRFGPKARLSRWAAGESEASRGRSGQLDVGAFGLWHWVMVSGVVVTTMVVYVWVSSAGMWSRPPSATSYYDALAQAFLQHQTSLLIEPDPRLLELDNPYSMKEREGIQTLWDASYFEGEYFLYFGPAPAIAAVAARLSPIASISDAEITLVASGILLVVSVAMLATLWRWGFAGRLPGWLFFAGLIAVAYSLPVLWVLNNPTVHEAAAASGAAFFLLGVFAAQPSLASERTPRWRLMLAGWFWVLAIGSRAVLAVPSAAAVILVGRTLYSKRESTKAVLGDILCLATPLVIGAGLLGWYNYDRFGDPFELGFRYQLSWREGSMEYAFAPRYLLLNTYNYLASGFSRLSVFPYIKPVWGAKSLPLPFFNEHPREYIAEKVSGMLITAPAHIFAFFLAWWVSCGSRTPETLGSHDTGLSFRGKEMQIRSLAASMLILALVGFLPIGIYYWAANRFLMDFVPLVTILSVLGAWVAVERNRVGCLPRIGLPAVIALLFLASLIMALLLALSGDTLRFEVINPELFDRLTRALTW